jgi:hydrogenase nickel insertion protein HypA
MHEQGIAQKMVSVALLHANANQAQRITQFHIEMSRIADESEGSLRFYLENLTYGTIAQNAQFEIARVGVPAHCEECGTEYEQQTLGEPCPRCHSSQVATESLEEFRLTSIQVE